MPKKIEKSTAMTFRLVHQGDETVLMPVNEAAEQSGLFQYDRKKSKSSKKPLPTPEDLENEDCYFPADGYDYERHLRTVNKDRLYEAEQVSAFDRANSVSAAQREVLDALNDDAYVEDDVDDYFDDLETANVKEDLNDVLWGGWKPEIPFDRPPISEASEEEDEDDYEEEDFDEEFSEYEEDSDCSDESEFFRVLDEYDDIGAGDYEEEGENFSDDAAIELVRREEKIFDPVKEREELLESKATTLMLLETMEEENSDLPFLVQPKPKPKFDCESVLSLRSNISNHPGKISSRIVKAPVEKLAPVLTPTPEEEEEISDVDESPNPWDTIAKLGTVVRVGKETPEDRKLRKAAVKEAQREARKLKKETIDTIKLKARTKAARFVGNGDLPQGVAKRRI